MTALVCAFSRAYHFRNNDTTIFSDDLAEKIISEKEYNDISDNMSKGINYFNPTFKGDNKQALKWIVDNQLSPSPLGRARFCEDKVKETVSANGVKQYLIFAAGYDTFAYRNPYNSLHVFEIDHPETQADKRKRVRNLDKDNKVDYISCDFAEDDVGKAVCKNEKFANDEKCFCSLMGISYYLAKKEFSNLLNQISSIISEGSFISFDYPDEHTFTKKAGEFTKKQVLMAKMAGEEMKASYNILEMTQILLENGFIISEHLNPQQINTIIFSEYNKLNFESKITAAENVNYVVAVKNTKRR